MICYFRGGRTRLTPPNNERGVDIYDLPAHVGLTISLRVLLNYLGRVSDLLLHVFHLMMKRSHGARFDVLEGCIMSVVLSRYDGYPSRPWQA